MSSRAVTVADCTHSSFASCSAGTSTINGDARHQSHHSRVGCGKRQGVIDYCLDRAVAVYERYAGEAINGGPSDELNSFIGQGDGENLLFILAQAELPPHNRTKRLLNTAQACSPSFAASDLRHLTCRLASAVHPEAASIISPDTITVMPEQEWLSLGSELDIAVVNKHWRGATKIVVDWWVAAKLRHDAVQMTYVQTAAARHLDGLCFFVALARQYWQKPPKQAQLIHSQEDRVYFICHLFFVLSNWCREFPLASVAAAHRLRRWLSYMNEVYTIVMRNIDFHAQQYALEIVVELAMCLRFDWNLYGDQLEILTALFIDMPLQDLPHGFVFMPNNNRSYHGRGYLPIADYHTHCLIAFFLTHSARNDSLGPTQIMRGA